MGSGNAGGVATLLNKVRYVTRTSNHNAADAKNGAPPAKYCAKPRCHLEEQGDEGWRGKGVKVKCKTHKQVSYDC